MVTAMTKRPIALFALGMLLLSSRLAAQDRRAEFIALGTQAAAFLAEGRFRLYPELNHLFLAGEGKSSPAEYYQKGNVPEKVMADIAAWIKNDIPGPR
jgi:hypothetical protein